MNWITTTVLLDRLADADDAAWNDFLGRFREPVVRFAQRMGLPREDAEDVAQDALLGFVDTWRRGRYDRLRGRLSSWLFVLARQRVLDWRRRAARDRERSPPEAATPAPLHELPDDGAARHTWDTSWQEVVLESCLDRVRGEFRPQTMEAFEAFVLADRPAEDVARDLGMTSNAVFIAKHRVLKRLREMQADYESIA